MKMTFGKPESHHYSFVQMVISPGTAIYRLCRSLESSKQVLNVSYTVVSHLQKQNSFDNCNLQKLLLEGAFVPAYFIMHCFLPVQNHK